MQIGTIVNRRKDSILRRTFFHQAGTLEKLVDSLASDTGELESTYINVFLNTYRTFASAKQVLNLLTERSVPLPIPSCSVMIVAEP